MKPVENPKQPLPEPATMLATEKIVVRTTGDGAKPVRRNFPGPGNADAALRVTFERRAYADLIAHAKQSVDVEVCGVLAGEVCEDSEGAFVHVSAAIPGTAASQGSTHVTFTQSTWNSIHKTLESDYPKLKIVGWYHTHPGFGVEFSDMDLFIQKNFFGGPAQIAMVTDPLSGATAICLNTAQGVRYLPRFWVDGREQPCRVPESKRAGTSNRDPAAGAAEAGQSDLAALEARVSQLVQAVDEQRAWQHSFMLFCGFVFCVGIIVGVGYFMLKTYNYRLEPPQVRQLIPVPIQVGDKVVMVGVGVFDWKVPAELNALLLQEELLRKAAEERAAKEAAKKQPNATNAVDSTESPETKK
jgi:proteasome lid subunit RPN8/RPN11